MLVYLCNITIPNLGKSQGIPSGRILDAIRCSSRTSDSSKMYVPVQVCLLLQTQPALILLLTLRKQKQYNLHKAKLSLTSSAQTLKDNRSEWLCTKDTYVPAPLSEQSSTGHGEPFICYQAFFGFCSVIIKFLEQAKLKRQPANFTQKTRGKKKLSL